MPMVLVKLNSSLAIQPRFRGWMLAVWAPAALVLFLLAPVSACAQEDATQLPDLSGWRVKTTWEDPIEGLKDRRTLDQATQAAQAEQNRRLNAFFIRDSLVDTLLAIHRRSSQATGTVSGYRVQLYSGNNGEATDTRMNFLEMYRNVKVYSIYDQPYFKVRVGNFVTRYEADVFCKELRQHFPGAFVVPDEVSLER